MASQQLRSFALDIAARMSPASGSASVTGILQTADRLVAWLEQGDTPQTEEDLSGFLLQWLDEVDPDEISLDDLPMSVGPVEAVLDALRKRAVSG